jgi:hypothetical protein
LGNADPPEEAWQFYGEERSSSESKEGKETRPRRKPRALALYHGVDVIRSHVEQNASAGVGIDAIEENFGLLTKHIRQNRAEGLAFAACDSIVGTHGNILAHFLDSPRIIP